MDGRACRKARLAECEQPTFTSFSTPFSPPLISADVYFYFRDKATGLITGVQPVHFRPDGKVVIDDRIRYRRPEQVCPLRRGSSWAVPRRRPTVEASR